MGRERLYGYEIERLLHGRNVSEPLALDSRAVGERNREVQIEPFGCSGRGDRARNACARGLADVIGRIGDIVVKLERTPAAFRRQIDRPTDIEVAQTQLYSIFAGCKFRGSLRSHEAECEIVHKRLLIAEYLLHVGFRHYFALVTFRWSLLSQPDANAPA